MAQPSSEAQATQAGLALLVLQDLEQAWPHLDPANLKGTLPNFGLIVHALTTKYGRISAALSGRYYQGVRRAAGLSSGSLKAASPPPLEQVRTVLGWATTDLWADPAAEPVARVKVDGVVTKLVQDVGRHTIVQTVHADPAAKGWARVPEPGCCAFCALLATRGAVYKSNQSAAFKSHDHCRCHAEPIFTAYEPSAQVREWQAQYAQATRGVRGSRNQRNAWRQAFEGN